MVKTPKAVLEAQLKAWDALMAEKSKDNPFFTKVLESQKAWASACGAVWRQEIMVDQSPAYEHFFKKALARVRRWYPWYGGACRADWQAPPGVSAEES